MRNLLVSLDFLTLTLYLGTALLILLYNLKRPVESRIYLVIAFLLISGSFSFQLVEVFFSFVFLSLLREYLLALGLIFFTTVVVEVLSGSHQTGLYYLLGSLGLTSLFALTAIATLNFNLSTYPLHWSFPVWLIVQMIILGVLAYFLVMSALRTKQKGPIVYATVFILFFAERLVEALRFYLLNENFALYMLTEKFLHLLASFSVFTYAGYGLIKISLPKKEKT